MTFVRFDTQEQLCDHAADRIARIGAEAIRDRGRLLLALSGGETPRPVYERLAASARLDWEAIDVFWTDERCIPASDEWSNARMAREALLDRVAIPSDRIHPIEGDRRPMEAADAYEVLLRRVLGEDGRLDLVLLGLGTDGHTASLFSRHQALTETGRWVVPVHAPADPPWHVTMTLPLINAARHVLLLVTGARKAAAVRDLAGGRPLPASMVRPTMGKVEFLFDAEAASLLSK